MNAHTFIDYSLTFGAHQHVVNKHQGNAVWFLLTRFPENVMLKISMKTDVMAFPSCCAPCWDKSSTLTK